MEIRDNAELTLFDDLLEGQCFKTKKDYFMRIIEVSPVRPAQGCWSRNAVNLNSGVLFHFNSDYPVQKIDLKCEVIYNG